MMGLELPPVPSCLTSDGKWIPLEADEAADSRYAPSPKFSARFKGAEGLILVQIMDKKYSVLSSQQSRTD